MSQHQPRFKMEWSLQTRDLMDTVVPVARELGVGIVAYSPLGRGFLSSSFKRPDELDKGDWRLGQPRFSPENFEKNVVSGRFEEMAQRKGCTPAQLSLAWVLAQGASLGPAWQTHLSSNLIALH